MRMGDFKGALTELLVVASTATASISIGWQVEKLGPISEQMQRLEKDRGYVHKVNRLSQTTYPLGHCSGA